MSGSGKNLAVVSHFWNHELFLPKKIKGFHFYFIFFIFFTDIINQFFFLFSYVFFTSITLQSFLDFVLNVHSTYELVFTLEKTVFTEELHKRLLTVVFLKGRYTFLKRFISTFILSLMPITCSDIKNFVFHIFGNYHPRLNFTVLLQISDGKYQNIVLTPICANLILHASVFMWKWHFQPFSVILDQMFSPNIREIFFKISEKS